MQAGSIVDHTVWKSFSLMSNHTMHAALLQTVEHHEDVDKHRSGLPEEHASASQCWVQNSETEGVWQTDHHQKVFEVIATSDCIWSQSNKVSSSSWEQCWKRIRDVALCIEFIEGVPLLGGYGTVLSDWWDCSSFLDCQTVSCSVSLWAVLGTNVLARWAL